MNARFPGIDAKIALQNGELFLYQSLRFDLVPLTGLEPVRCCQRGIFSPHHVAIAARKRCGPDFLFTLDESLGARRQVSTRSRNGPGFARHCPARTGVSPNLARFTRTVSRSGAQILSPLCLPIPPQRHKERPQYTIFRPAMQVLFFRRFPLVPEAVG